MPEAVEVSAEIRRAAEKAGVRALVHARGLGSDGGEFGVDADGAVVLASVFKIPVALALGRQFAVGELDPQERVRVPVEGRTSGGTGLSVMRDEVELSLRDLGRSMITVSDNAATDIVMARVGLENINATLRECGLGRTVVDGDCSWLLTRLMTEVDMTGPEQARLAAGDEDVLSDIATERWLRCQDLQPEQTNRSTPREMTRLLELIWKDEAGPPEACAYVREVMGQQVWPHRLRAGFPGSVRVSGKTGTLPFVRNETGVVEYADGRRFAVAVFTFAADAALNAPARDRVIGEIAALAVGSLL